MTNGKSNHSFRNYSVDEWLGSFQRHFSVNRLSLTITGGEPMADRNSIVALVNGLTAMSTVECIRIDTNAYWEPERYRDLDRSKVIMNCSYHPEQTNEDAYFDRMRRIVASGFHIGMVNYVFYGDRAIRYGEHKSRLRKLGIPINPNSEFHSRRTKEERELLVREIPALEFSQKVLQIPTDGEQCLYPAIAYDMDYEGNVSVACFPSVSGSFFDVKLPKQPAGPVSCPAKNCFCTDKYVMLKRAKSLRAAAINPLAYYSEELLRIQDQKESTVLL
ncbi:MAG: hypothetical protein ABR956_01510 [Terracidiphilus sp.]